MEIELKKIPVRDLYEDYEDDAEGGVRGYSSKLDIRPPYQREFVYDAKERNKAVEDNSVTRSALHSVPHFDVGEEK